MKRPTRILSWLGLGLVALALTSCSSEDVTVHWDRAEESERMAGPCLVLAGNAELRDESDVQFSKMDIYIDEVDQEITETIDYRVSGRTRVTGGPGGTATYAWECLSKLSKNGESVSAQIEYFAKT